MSGNPLLVRYDRPNTQIGPSFFDRTTRNCVFNPRGTSGGVFDSVGKWQDTGSIFAEQFFLKFGLFSAKSIFYNVLICSFRNPVVADECQTNFVL